MSRRGSFISRGRRLLLPGPSGRRREARREPRCRHDLLRFDIVDPKSHVLRSAVTPEFSYRDLAVGCPPARTLVFFSDATRSSVRNLDGRLRADSGLRSIGCDWLGGGFVRIPEVPPLPGCTTGANRSARSARGRGGKKSSTSFGAFLSARLPQEVARAQPEPWQRPHRRGAHALRSSRYLAGNEHMNAPSRSIRALPEEFVRTWHCWRTDCSTQPTSSGSSGGLPRGYECTPPVRQSARGRARRSAWLRRRP